MSTTTLNVLPEKGNTGIGVTFPAPLEPIADGDYRYFNRGGRVRLLVYMPASATFHIVVKSVADKFGRTKDIAQTHTTAGAAPELRVIGPFTPGLWNQKAGGDTDYVLFTVSATTGSVKVAAAYGP